MKDLCKHKEVAKGQMAMKETAGGDMTREEGRIGGRQAEATIVKGKTIEVVEEENGIETTIMARTGSWIRGGKEIGKSRPYTKEETAKGGDPIFNHENQPNMKAVTPGEV